MKNSRSPLFASLLAAASCTVLLSTSHAANYIEVGDAGQTLAGAPNAGAVTGFSGNLSSANDADLYMFTIANAGTYRFSDVGATNDTTLGGTALAPIALDTEISLFSSAGVPLFTNDDTTGTVVESSFTVTLAAGTYYFGITNSGNAPVNSNSQLLFSGYPAGDTTATRGMASGLNPTTLATFNTQSYTNDLGSYSVTINAVPEPSTWAALALGGLAIGATGLRRRLALS